MPTYFQKPENALKRAEELIRVGKPNQALDVLYDVIKSKRHRTWLSVHEEIMLLYLELCVDLKKSHLAKEGLYQYKNICQLVNVKSLDTVIRRYLNLASEKTEAAREESQQTCLDVDDLDVIQTPESLLLAAVTAEDAQDRSDRAILTPWVKFLWESYRQCLDLLRNNNRVERLYHDIAKQAFDFCLKYTRKTEFRKLCDNLRNHLKQIVEKTHTQPNAVSLNNPESVIMHLETRLNQLDSAISMELWQEAFKAVEDIHDLIVRSKKVPKPSLLANYFENVSLVFLKSGNRLFHAAACHRLYMLISEQKKNPSPEEITRMANRVLCSTLSIPIPPTRYSIDQLLESNDSEKRRRLASLLSLSSVPTPPTRTTLVKDLIRNNIMHHVSPELKSLYADLEVEFDPLHLSSNLSKCVEFVEQQDDLLKYADALREMMVVRLIKQVAQVYQCIQFEKLRKLIPFVTAFELERIVVQAAKNIDLPVRLDHRNQTVSFGTDLNVCLQEDVEEGPFLQHMPGEQLRNQLQHMAKALCSAITRLNADESDKALNLETKLKITDAYRKSEKRDRQKILTRKNVIENRKEKLEIISKERDEQEMEREREKQKQLREAEELRLKREMAERERQRAVQEHENIRKKEAEKRIEQLKTTDIGIRALEGLTEEELAELDTDDILQKQVEQLEKEKRELQERLRSQDKKVDYFIRAKRLEEIPLLETYAEEQATKTREQWHLMETQRIEGLKKERELAMMHKDRLRRMIPDKDEFVAQLNESRQDDYNKRLEEFNSELAAIRSERLAERREARKEERRRKTLLAREERKQRERDEAVRKEREARIAKEKEEEDKKRRAEEERLAKLEESAAKQRQRDLEVEQKLARDRENIPPPAKGSVGWREREAAKHDSWMKKSEGDEENAWSRGQTDRRDEPRRIDSHRDNRREVPWRPSSDKREPDRFERRDDRRDDRFERRDDKPWSRGGEDSWSRGGESRPRQDNYPRREDNRDFGRRDDNRDFSRREDSRDFGRREDSRDFSRREESRDVGRRDDHRDHGRRDDNREFNYRSDRSGRGGGTESNDGWRGDSGPPRRDGPSRGSGGPPRGNDDVWRRGGEKPKRQEDTKSSDSDGWNTVRYGK